MDPDNMKFRLEDLTVDSILQDCGISPEEAKEMPPDIVKLFIEDFIPTKEDLRQPISEEGLKELCLRVKCRALMYRWNPVHDYVRRFEREGRLPRWSPKKRLKLLAKAVNRYKADGYTEEEICLQREREWCERKKENLMRLQLWEYDRQQQQQQQEAEEQPNAEQRERSQTPYSLHAIEEVETPNRKRRRATLRPPQQNNAAAETESHVNIALNYGNTSPSLPASLHTRAEAFNNQPQIMTQIHALPQSQPQLQPENPSDVEANDLLTSVDSTIINRDLLHMLQLQQQEEVQTTEELRQQMQQSPNASNGSLEEANNNDDETPHRMPHEELHAAVASLNIVTEEVVQTQSTSFQLLTQEETQNFTATVPLAQEMADVQDFININTESMSITETPLDSENLFSERAEGCSEENTPPYTEFDNQISLTSTQSPDF